MNYITDTFNLIFLGPITNLLIFTYRLLEASHVPGALGFAIVILTTLIRFLIWPFIAAQLKSSQKMAELRPHLQELQKKHGKDKQALAQSQMALYKEHGVNPTAGCLPSLVQLPVVIGLYQTILAMFEGQGGLDKINALLYVPSWKLGATPDLGFLGLNLASRPSDFLSAGYFLLLVPVITALLQFAQSKMMTPSPVKVYPSDSPKEQSEKKTSEDTMAAVQSQMIFMMPLMIGYFSFSFPVGVSIYWNTFTLLGIWQQHKISGWGGLGTLIQSLKIKVKS